MNGYDAQDMATQGADGFRNGYQAGYADAVKAIEAAQPAAAQEAVVWQRRYIGATRSGHPAEWHTITKAKFDETKTGKWANLYEVRELYAAPVNAAPDMVRTEIQRALSELDRVQTAEDHTSYCIGCAENALHRALEAIAAALRAAPEGFLMVQTTDAECLVRDAERFLGGGHSVGGRLAAKRVRAILAARPQEASDA